MDLSHITFELASDRYEEIPERFREILESPGTKTTLVRVGAEHSLDHERQELLESLVALVFLGFLSPDDLAGEFSDRLLLNFVHARALAHTIDETFFAPVRHDLARVYNPVGGVPQAPTVRAVERAESGGKTILLESIGTARAEERVPVSSNPAAPGRRPDDIAAPLVILGTNGPAGQIPVVPPKAPMRQTSRFPFRFPMHARADEQTSGPTAVVRMPGAPTPKKDEPRVVHYTETRGALGAPLPTNPAPKSAGGKLDALSASGTMVNLDQVGQVIHAPKSDTPPANQRQQPKMDGNTIDLRQKNSKS